MTELYVFLVDNNCDSTSCYNGGSCTDSIGSFSCACSRGFTGSFCEINIDDCLHNACDNNATCVDGHDEYSCVCPAGFKGDLCETRFGLYYVFKVESKDK